MIARYWSARTSIEKAPAYARHLASAVVPELKKLDGYRNIELLRREMAGGIEVVVITYWDSLADIQAFAGEDIEAAVVAPEAAALLTEFDKRVRHYEIVF